MNLTNPFFRIRLLLASFIAALAVSGITAVPLKWEIGLLNQFLGEGSWITPTWPSLSHWISYVYTGILETDNLYPFINYGTDWLAFGHIMIAIFFIGPLIDPVRNAWVVRAGLIACALVIPWALIFGPLRGIPPFWRLIDCSFGIFGAIPLLLVEREIRMLAALTRPSYSCD
jgi:hypothetical protein